MHTRTREPEPAVATDLDTLEDAQLAALAREDPTGPGFRALYERHRATVWRFLLRLVGDAALAEDLLQESFFRAYQQLARYDAGRAFRPWLLGIARNTALHALRARGKPGPSPRASHSDRVPHQAAAREGERLAREALQDLPDDERALLIQRHALGLPLAELAAAWGCTERTIRNRLHAATAALTRALLARRGR